jgi:hypothetical protein
VRLLETSASGPMLPTWALQQSRKVTGGYTGGDGSLLGEAALDPEQKAFECDSLPVC